MEEKVSIVIPNFNGRELLAKNLPEVTRVCPKSEIIVVDDASQDDSALLVKKRFKKVKVIENKKNLGFARSANIGVKAASGQYVLLFNTDVSPRPDFLKPALVHFQKHKNLFAVGLADQSHEDGTIITRGRGGAKFKRGFLNHFAQKPRFGETLWVSGGSGLFDRQKFLALGGFDPAFAPFYWEDIDLCWRARKQGLVCLFEPRALVDHYHQQGAIKKSHWPVYIKTVAYKNQFLFVWKNISDYSQVALHLLWLPYHFAKALLTLDLVFFLGFIWAISQIPQLILNYQLLTTNYQLSDKEIINAFAKP